MHSTAFLNFPRAILQYWISCYFIFTSTLYGIILYFTFHATTCCSRRQVSLHILSGIRHCVNEICALLGIFTRLRCIVTYICFEAKYRSTRVEGSKKNVSWTVRPLEMGPTDCPETSVRSYHSALRKIPQEGRLPLHFSGIIFKPCFHFDLYTSYSCVLPDDDS